MKAFWRRTVVRTDAECRCDAGRRARRCPAQTGSGAVWQRIVVVLAALLSSAALARAQETDVELVFDLPSAFADGNLPANVDASEPEATLFQGDFITTESSNLGSLDANPAVDTQSVTTPEDGPTTEEAAPPEEPAEEPVEETPAPAKVKKASVGAASLAIDATVTEDFQVIAFPIAYRVNPNLKVGATVPYIRRQGDEGEVSGLGDVSFSLGVRWGNPLKVLGITTAFVKAPTGEPDARDQGEFLPTGTGSWDYAFYQTFIKRLGRWRGELTVGYRFNTEADFEAAGSDITLENGDVANVIVGLDRELPLLAGLVGSVKVDGRYIQEADLTIDGQPQETPGARAFVDLLPGVKYFLGPGTALRLGLRVPLSDFRDRSVALDLGVAQRF